MSCYDLVSYSSPDVLGLYIVRCGTFPHDGTTKTPVCVCSYHLLPRFGEPCAPKLRHGQ